MEKDFIKVKIKDCIIDCKKEYEKLINDIEKLIERYDKKEIDLICQLEIYAIYLDFNLLLVGIILSIFAIVVTVQQISSLVIIPCSLFLIWISFFWSMYLF